MDLFSQLANMSYRPIQAHVDTNMHTFVV